MPRFDCQSESSLGQYADFATLIMRSNVELLERRTHPWIVIDGVLERLIQRQTRRWRLLWWRLGSLS